MIWNHAIRPDLPGVHIFGLHHATAAGDPDQLSKEQSASLLPATKNTPTSMVAELRLSPPHGCQPYHADTTHTGARAADPICESVSWAPNNPSTYLIDGGLWAACRESYLAIEEEFCRRANKSGQAWSCCYVDSAGRHVAVFPDQDLYILQPGDEITVADWAALCLRADLRRPSAGYSLKEHTPTGSRIALEYTPQGDSEAEGGSEPIIVETLSGLASQQLQLQPTPTDFWIINYGLRLKHYVPTRKEAEGRDLAIFYANDRRFVLARLPNGLGSGWWQWRGVVWLARRVLACDSTLG